MSFQIISNICLFAVLLCLFCYVEVLPFSTGKIKCITVGGIAVLIGINVLIFILFPHMSVGEIRLFGQILPSLIYCQIVSKHKDMRFWFMYCSMNVIDFMVQIIVNGMAILFYFDKITVFIFEMLFMGFFCYMFYRYGKEFREVVDKKNVNWGLLTAFVIALYGYSYFLLLYPEPWGKRTAYTPVFVGYAALALLSYVFLVEMIVSVGKMHDLEQEELGMKMQLELQDKELQNQEAKILLHQMKPHFIYNVLMTIRYFVKKDPQVAYDMIYDFSRYLRSNVESLVENEYILWKNELEHIHTYVRIEEIRFGNRLNVIYEIEDAEFYLPPLTVELLVENAIKHGISPKAEGGTVWIQGSVADDGYQIIVEDDGVGFPIEDLDKEKSIGLNYIRLQMEKMPDADIKLESTLGQGTKATLWFGGGKIL